MNKLDFDFSQIIKFLHVHKYTNQRDISKQLGISLGTVNSSIKYLKKMKLLAYDNTLTIKSKELLENNIPDKAVLLAAGIGLRMIPINNSVPKALIKINGEVLIERIIKQLHSTGINDIYIVVGFMKEKFDYLIDKYNVKLIVNPFYLDKNNIYSLYLLKDKISNSYIVPCDLWFNSNPFNSVELQSWYLLSDEERTTNNAYLNKKNEVIISKKGLHRMIGLAYINKNDGIVLSKKLSFYINSGKYNDAFWEEILFDDKKMIIYGKLTNKNEVTEINTYEELRALDDKSSSLRNDVLKVITDILNVDFSDIINITCLKKGMTNRSFLFEVNNEKFIMRIPGEGTDQLINRSEEGEVYNAIHSLNISDDVLYFNVKNGYKLTKFLPNSRVCDINNITDLNKCMSLLKRFHYSNAKVTHFFDLYEKIEFYENLRGTNNSLYDDYELTKENIYKLKSILDKYPKHYSLTHIDAVPDNFLFYDNDGKEDIRLIDWEYASMQDTDVDIAMFCIYALYDKKDVDRLIDIYYENNCTYEIKIKIYCYIAICGFLWSNWCEYKYTLGVEFGEYSLRQYRYAKDYYKIVMDLVGGEK